MSSDNSAYAPIDPESIRNYLETSPDSVASINDYNVRIALNQLDEAAKIATTRDEAGKRWVPGLAIVVVGRKNQVLHCDGHGMKRVDGNATVGPDTLFPCASLSKPVSATLLAHAGVPKKLAPKSRPEIEGWDQPVRYAIVRPSVTERTTLRQWLSHRSGLPDHAGDRIEDLNPSMPLDTLINCLLKHQTGIQPGAFNYTNFGFTLGCLGGMEALGAGTRWEDAAKAWLNELGMSRSTYAFTHADQDPHADRAFPHIGQPEPPTLLLDVVRTGWTWRVVNRDLERDPTLQAPAGSLLSCARDLGAFLIRLLDKGFTAFPPTHPPAADLKGKQYSLGWNVRNPGKESVSFSHSGAFRLGAGTYLRFDPLSGFGVAVLSNGEPTGVPEALGTLFFNQLYGHQLPPASDYASLFALFRSLMMKEMYTTKIDNYKRYHGRRNETIPNSIPHGRVFEGSSPYYASQIVIERKGANDLVLKLGNAKNGFPLWELPLRCIDATTLTFVYDTRGENEVGPSAIQLIQENGTVVKVIDEWLNGSGPGLGEIARQV